MKKSNAFLLVGALLLAGAFLFIWYSVFASFSSFPWSLAVTYTIYGVYVVVTAVMLLLSLRFQLKNERCLPKLLLTAGCLCLTGMLVCFLVYLVTLIPYLFMALYPLAVVSIGLLIASPVSWVVQKTRKK